MRRLLRKQQAIHAGVANRCSTLLRKYESRIALRAFADQHVAERMRDALHELHLLAVGDDLRASSGVTVTRSEYGSSVSSARLSSSCAIRSLSAIACFGADSSASASRLIGLTSAARLMLTWMRSASVSTAGFSHVGLASAIAGRVAPVRRRPRRAVGRAGSARRNSPRPCRSVCAAC